LESENFICDAIARVKSAPVSSSWYVQLSRGLFTKPMAQNFRWF